LQTGNDIIAIPPPKALRAHVNDKSERTTQTF